MFVSLESKGSGGWLPRQEVTEALRRHDVLVKSKSGKVSKGTILDVKHDKDGCKYVSYESQGKKLTKKYGLGDGNVTDFALR